MLQKFIINFNFYKKTNDRFLFIYIEGKIDSKKNEKILGKLVDKLCIG